MMSVQSNVYQKYLIKDNTNSVELDKGSIIDSKIRKFFFKSGDKEVERDLRVTISLIEGSCIEDKKIIIELTNDSNPIFLFTLHITKSDFEILKSDQGINVDFNGFPSELVNLLNKCEESVSSSSSGIFKLILEDYCMGYSGKSLNDTNKFKVKILELGTFRNLCHLTIEVVRGSDTQIQEKLEAELCKIKRCLFNETKLHNESTAKINELIEQIRGKNENIESLNQQITELQKQREDDLKKIETESGSKIKCLQDKYENKIHQTEHQSHKKIEKLQEVIKTQENDIDKLKERQVDMATEIVEKEKELQLTKAELISMVQETNVLKSQNSKLDSDYHEKERTVNILRTRLAVTDQELKDKEIFLKNIQKTLDETCHEKSELLKNNEFIKNKLEKKESVVINLSEELLKANEIISKQQNKISVFNRTIKEYEEKMHEKELLVENKEVVFLKNNQIISKLREDLDLLNKEVSVLTERCKHLELNVNEKNDKLEKSLKVISIMKDNIQDKNVVFKPEKSQSSLIFYRAFLSMPSLLPSDDSRRKNQLQPLISKNYPEDMFDYLDFNNKPSKKFSEKMNILKPFIKRYLRRFMNVPSSLFKSSDVPINVLLSPDGFNRTTYRKFSPKSYENFYFPCSKDNIDTNKHNYFPYSVSRQACPNGAAYESTISNAGLRNDKVHSLTNDKISNTKNDTVSNDFAVFRGTKPLETTKTAVGNFPKPDKSLKPFEKMPLRTSPAIIAPPLTAQQREANELGGKNLRPASILKTNKNNRMELNDQVNLSKKSSFKFVIQPRVKNSTVNNKDKEETEPSAYFIS